MANLNPRKRNSIDSLNIQEMIKGKGCNSIDRSVEENKKLRYK